MIGDYNGREREPKSYQRHLVDFSSPYYKAWEREPKSYQRQLVDFQVPTTKAGNASPNPTNGSW